MWFSLPIAALAVCIIDPAAAAKVVKIADQWARQHTRIILSSLSLAVGTVLLVHGLWLVWSRPGFYLWRRRSDGPNPSRPTMVPAPPPAQSRGLGEVVAASDDVEGCEHLSAQIHVCLPAIFTPDGEGGSPATLLTGLHHVFGRMLQVQVVVHPLSDFRHQFEQAGLAVKLWPDPPGSLNIEQLPGLSAQGRQQLGSLFVDAKIGAHLPGSGWREYVEAVPDGGPLPPPVMYQRIDP